MNTSAAISEMMRTACEVLNFGEPDEITILRPMKEPTENQIQADFFSWLSLHQKKHPELALFYAIPNGSHKSPAARGLFQRTGLKPGRS
jgi:hypothetical protein